MDVFFELFKSPIGWLSLFTIGFIISMACFLFVWVKKQADAEESKLHD